jgi:hypothetical protein
VSDLTIAADPSIELRAAHEDLASDPIVGQGVNGIQEVIPKLART